jgi:hypothetical protein
MPAPPVFDHGVIGEQGRAQADGPLDLPFQVGGVQVQMQPVLVVLVIAGALQEHLDAVAVCGDQAPGTASCSRRALRHRQRQHAFPLGQSVRLAGLMRPVAISTIPARRCTSSGLPCRNSRRAPGSAFPPSP